MARVHYTKEHRPDGLSSRFGCRWTDSEVEILRVAWLNAPLGNRGQPSWLCLKAALPHRTDFTVGIRKLRRRGLIPRLQTEHYNLSAVDACFLATCLETEGCIYERKNKFGAWHADISIITNTDMGLINEVLRILPTAKMVSRYPNVPRKPIYVVKISRVGQFVPLLRILLPYMHSYKKALAERVIARYGTGIV